ncbi:ABC transporter ATP-binding protein [Bifidobacterium sp. ESL0769]|uniref:ABC transporter ATP-binding protein n=1 Tax=Bifidobacterium sp. ESL0769 TaxID=2983229 RepID=UPI0023F82B28|nr:ABC transporter ATP-binding protein [Bifidobacterium sp. ESL0769]WEV67253.1 ABC transporter ATP-binding protein [Bifidobacterium sp. ESL0769]
MKKKSNPKLTLPEDVAIQVSHVSKHFSLRANSSIKESIIKLFTPKKKRHHDQQFHALDDISFTIDKGETVGLIGVNGSGKSTMLKMISGVMQPDSGDVLIRGRLAGLIEVGAGFASELTGRENVYLNGAILGLSEKQIDERYDDIVAFSGIEPFMDTEVKFYSSGMFLRLAFAVAVYSNPDIFLIDEILAVGDEAFQHKCIERLKEQQKQGQTMVIVSHSEGQIKELCQRCIVLAHSHVIFDGDPEEAFNVMRQNL